MSHATLDRVLAVLVVSMAATGLLSLRSGAPDAAWVFTLHGILGGSLVVATAIKLRRSVPKAVRARHVGRLALGLLLSLVTITALSGGFLWVASGELLTLGTWTVLTLHAWVGLALLPLVVVHLLPRRWRLLRPIRGGAATRTCSAGRVSRRSLLAAGGLVTGGLGLFAVSVLIDRWRGGERRFTGSRWLPSGGIPPVTTFFGEGTPTIDAGAWRVTVSTTDREAATWSMVELRALGETDLAAVLDCTSGWVLETGWRGVPMAALLRASGVDPDAAHGNVRVTSVTGWSTDLPMAEARGSLLATGVAGGDLPIGNGAPCRLVVPDRRGLDWVKWVAEIRVT